jgi:hypothetical protein
MKDMSWLLMKLGVLVLEFAKEVFLRVFRSFGLCSHDGWVLTEG